MGRVRDDDGRDHASGDAVGAGPVPGAGGRAPDADVRGLRVVAEAGERRPWYLPVNFLYLLLAEDFDPRWGVVRVLDGDTEIARRRLRTRRAADHARDELVDRVEAWPGPDVRAADWQAELDRL